jgi:recombination protein RecA
MGQSNVGLHARLMSQAMRKLSGAVAKANCVCIFINQLREKVGVMYGNPEVTTGGRALKYYASMRIDVRKVEQLKGTGGEFIGSRTKAKIVKNKVAPPFKTAEFDIMFGKGIAVEGEILDLAVQYDIIHKSGAWFSYNDERLGQGRDNVRELLRTNKELRAEIEAKVRAKFSEKSDIKVEASDDNDLPLPPAPVVAPPAPKGKLKANLDIAVDDDE